MCVCVCVCVLRSASVRGCRRRVNRFPGRWIYEAPSCACVSQPWCCPIKRLHVQTRIIYRLRPLPPTIITLMNRWFDGLRLPSFLCSKFSRVGGSRCTDAGLQDLVLAGLRILNKLTMNNVNWDLEIWNTFSIGWLASTLDAWWGRRICFYYVQPNSELGYSGSSLIRKYSYP